MISGGLRKRPPDSIWPRGSAHWDCFAACLFKRKVSRCVRRTSFAVADDQSHRRASIKQTRQRLATARDFRTLHCLPLTRVPTLSDLDQKTVCRGLSSPNRDRKSLVAARV